MSTIAATANSPAPQTLLERSGAKPNGGNAAAAAPATAKGAAVSGSYRAPATTVELSDRAKALLERSKIEQAVADRLAQHLALMRDGNKNKKSDSDRGFFEILSGHRIIARDGASLDDNKNNHSDEGLGILDRRGRQSLAEIWGAQAKTDTIGTLKSSLADQYKDTNKWEAIQRRQEAGEVFAISDHPLSDNEAIVQGVYLGFMSRIIHLEDSGEQDKAQKLRDAIKNGTLDIRKSSDVPGLNLTYTVSHFPDAGGGGSSSSWVWRPTDAVKAALYSGEAFAFGAGDRGAFYVTW